MRGIFGAPTVMPSLPDNGIKILVADDSLIIQRMPQQRLNDCLPAYPAISSAEADRLDLFGIGFLFLLSRFPSCDSRLTPCLLIVLDSFLHRIWKRIAVM